MLGLSETRAQFDSGNQADGQRIVALLSCGYGQQLEEQTSRTERNEAVGSPGLHRSAMPSLFLVGLFRDIWWRGLRASDAVGQLGGFAGWRDFSTLGS